MNDNLSKRVEREKEKYDEGILLGRGYEALLNSVNQSPSMERWLTTIKNLMFICKDKYALELGSSSWKSWIDFEGHAPRKLVSVNISQAELMKGVTDSNDMGLNNLIDFKIMDAHYLTFPDSSFDVVYGGSILHHLDLNKSIKEIWRILKKDGVIIFSEPLIYNPVAKIIRFLTPRARTADETPLGIKELYLINRYFYSTFYYFQLIDIPFCILSSIMLEKPSNAFTRLLDKIDRQISKLPYINLLYRGVVIFGIKK